MKTRSQMTLRRNLLVGGCVLLATIISLLVFRSSNTLSYEGKSISQWLAWFDSPSGLSQAQWQERFQRRSDATVALRQMGPEVYPYFRRMLRPDSKMTRLLHQSTTELKRELIPARSLVVPPSPEEARMLMAVEACSYLGRDAQAMIPDLLLVLKSNSHANVRARAAYALGAIGGAPEAVVPALVQSLSDPVDCNILISLGKYGADAAPAVPHIVALLDGIEASVNAHQRFDRNLLCEAARALHQIAPLQAEKILPLLRQVVQEEQDPFWQSRLGKVVNAINSGTSPNGQAN